MLGRVSLLALLLAACAASPPRTENGSSVRPGAGAQVALPELQLEDLDGSPASLTSALAGRPALVSLWATWCESCLTELGALGRLSTRAAAQGAYVLAVSEGESREVVQAFVKARGLAYAQLVDEKFALADALGQRSLPATVVVNRAGRIVFRGGALDEGALRALDDAIAAR